MEKKARPLFLAALTVLTLSLSGPVSSAEEPIVVGMSFAQHKTDGRDVRALAGINSYLGRVNAAGGIQGRKIVLQTLDDGGEPVRVAQNLRTLVKEHKAVAVIGCLTDAACQTTAEVASELKVPVVGAMSGLTTLSRKAYPYLFRLRADYAKEAQAIATQMAQMGHTRAALLSDGSAGPELDSLLQQGMARQNIAFDLIKITSAQPAHLAEIVNRLGGHHAAVLNIGSATVEALVNGGLSERAEWPRMLMSPASGNLATLLRSFNGRTIGFSMVVPNPELLRTPIAREINQDVDRYGSGWAITFDGMEAYLSTRLLVEALKRAGRNITSQQILSVLETAGAWDLSGFRVSFANERSTGSDWVEMGLRSAQGALVR